MELTWASNPANCRPFQQSTAAAQSDWDGSGMISFEELDIAVQSPGEVSMPQEGHICII